MAGIITDNAAFLEEARKALAKSKKLREYKEKLTIEEKRLDKAIAAEKKSVQDLISVTVKKRKDEVESSYDKEISSSKENIKKITLKREKAKNQEIKERISDETAILREHNRELKMQRNTIFKQNGVPKFCNSTFYYSLYFTKTFKEFLILIVTVTMCFLAVPSAIYYFLPVKKTIYMVGIYFVTVILFGGIYMAINNMTKVKYLEILSRGRRIRNSIYANNKNIKIITRTILKDKNDKVYNLDNFDDEISRLEGEISAICKRKQEALSNFENVTKNIIADEITGNSSERIMKLQEQLYDISEKCKEAEAANKAQSILITDTYEIYLGREFLNEERLVKLIDIINNKEADNISEAIQVFRSNKG